MTELLILGHIIWKWKKTVQAARKNAQHTAYRFLVYADTWIFLNLVLAIAISVPALNFYTHGTHITVAHAMGTTIGINTMLLMASVFYILNKEEEEGVTNSNRWINTGAIITNAALAVFWLALIISGMVKISSLLKKEGFAQMMNRSIPWFKLFAFSGAAIMIGLVILIIVTIRLLQPAPVPLSRPE
jgi:nitric oxide reductase subunit B